MPTFRQRPIDPTCSTSPALPATTTLNATPLQTTGDDSILSIDSISLFLRHWNIADLFAKSHAHVPYVSLRKNCEEKPDTVSGAHGIDHNNRNFIDEGQCSISHLVASHWEGVGFTFQCGLIGLLADSSDQNSRCFGKCVPDTPRGPSMRLDATNSHYTCFRPKFLMIPTKFASESACLDLHSLASLTSTTHIIDPSIPTKCLSSNAGPLRLQE